MNTKENDKKYILKVNHNEFVVSNQSGGRDIKKIIGVIPARYQSTRFPGKPLADICGKPMIWWVYQQVKKVESLSSVFVATDDEKIRSACIEYGMEVVMTSCDLPDHIARLKEVSERLDADWYVCINGDEPLIDPVSIQTVVDKAIDEHQYGFYGAFRYLNDPAETIDIAKIKLVLKSNGEAVYISRTPVPFPKNNLFFKYKKYIGIECYTKEALFFFASHAMGELEKTEDVDHLRFIENSFPICFTEVDSESISVDTPKDLEKVRAMMTKTMKERII